MQNKVIAGRELGVYGGDPSRLAVLEKLGRDAKPLFETINWYLTRQALQEAIANWSGNVPPEVLTRVSQNMSENQ